MIGKVQAIAKGGAGVIHEPDRTVFIPGVIAGETVEYAPVSRRKSVWQGKLLRVLEASPQRVEPPCPHYRECGGCNLQHMSYEEQLRSKSEILLANLKKIAGLVPAAAPGGTPVPALALSQQERVPGPRRRQRLFSKGIAARGLHQPLPAGARNGGSFFPRPRPGPGRLRERPVAGHRQRPGTRGPAAAARRAARLAQPPTRGRF